MKAVHATPAIPQEGGSKIEEMRRRPRMKTVIYAVALLTGLTFMVKASAKPYQISGHVTYVSHTSVYVDLGSRDGVHLGQLLSVQKGGSIVAELRVTFLSERSSSSRIVHRTGEVRPGDLIVSPVEMILLQKKTVEPEEKVPDLTPAEIADLWAQAFTRSQLSPEGREPADTLSVRTKEKSMKERVTHKVTGRLSVGYLRIDRSQVSSTSRNPRSRLTSTLSGSEGRILTSL